MKQFYAAMMAVAVYNVTSVQQLKDCITLNVILLSYKSSWLENS